MATEIIRIANEFILTNLADPISMLVPHSKKQEL